MRAHFFLPLSLLVDRTVGRVKVQIFKDVIPKSAVDVIMNGEKRASRRIPGEDFGRNPWPGIYTLCEQMFQSLFAVNFRHPYIAEISSRCDSTGPPQRLDMKLTPSGIVSLLPMRAIDAIEVSQLSLVYARCFQDLHSDDTFLFGSTHTRAGDHLGTEAPITICG